MATKINERHGDAHRGDAPRAHQLLTDRKAYASATRLDEQRSPGGQGGAGMKLSPQIRLSILSRWNAARAHAGKLSAGEAADALLMDNLIYSGFTLTMPTLYNWFHRYAAQGIDGLIDGRSLRGCVDRSNDRFLQECRRLRSALRRPPLSMIECHRLASAKAEAARWKTHSYKATRRYLIACGLGWRNYAFEHVMRVRRASKASKKAGEKSPALICARDSLANLMSPLANINGKLQQQ